MTSWGDAISVAEHSHSRVSDTLEHRKEMILFCRQRSMQRRRLSRREGPKGSTRCLCGGPCGLASAGHTLA